MGGCSARPAGRRSSPTRAAAWCCGPTAAPTRVAWSQTAVRQRGLAVACGSRRRRAARWAELNSPAAFRLVYRELRRVARAGTAMPFAVCLRRRRRRERLVGQVTLGNIVRRAFCSAYAGYWVDARVAGRGVIPTALALAVDHAFAAGGLHRIEVNIRLIALM